MDLVLLAARLSLAAVFAVSGVAKLADRPGSRRAIVGFGVPDRLAAPLAVLLPVAELAVAVALIPRGSAWGGAVGALGLLLLFCAGMGVNMALGRAPDCHCFGQLYSEPIGWPTLARNGVLAGVAGFVVWQGGADPGASAVAWLRGLTIAEGVGLALGMAALGLGAAALWLSLQLVAQQGRMFVRMDGLDVRIAEGPGLPVPAGPHAPSIPSPGLPVGSPAPAFSLPGLHGETATLDSLRALGKPVLLVFTDPACGPCAALMPDLGRWQLEHAAALTVALVSRGTPEANHAKSAEHHLSHLLVQKDFEVMEAYLAPGTPSAVLVRPDGRIGGPVATGVDGIRALVVHGTGGPAPAPTPAALPPGPPRALIGEEAPALALPDLDGKWVDLSSFRGKDTLVLFWNPGCGFCEQMLGDLRAWEERPPKGAPRLLVVSTGALEENRAMGLHSKVLMEPKFGAGFAFGADGTPSAVLVDARGKIASDVAVGAAAVLALAGQERASSATA